MRGMEEGNIEVGEKEGRETRGRWKKGVRSKDWIALERKKSQNLDKMLEMERTEEGKERGRSRKSNREETGKLWQGDRKAMKGKKGEAGEKTGGNREKERK